MKYLILGVLILLAFAGCKYPQQTGNQTAEGRVVFTITDAADLTAAQSIEAEISEIRVYSETKGWVAVATEPKTYDLLELRNGQHAVAADVNLEEGTYSQVSMKISQVTVVDANGTHEAAMPSGEININGTFVSKANSTSAVSFDIIADESLYETQDGEYVFAPVVQFESREDAEISIDSNSRATISGGSITSSLKVGMDIGGNVGVGSGIGQNANLTIENGVIKIGNVMAQTNSTVAILI